VSIRASASRYRRVLNKHQHCLVWCGFQARCVSPLGQAQEQVSARAVVETGDSEPAGRSLTVLILGTTLDTNGVPHHLAAGRCGSELGLVGETADELHAGQRVGGRG
jgi:hypothetical protein